MDLRQAELPLEGESILAPLPEADREEAFRRRVWEYHRSYRRPMEWRDNITSYGVFVSEVMLQQTQVNRVTERYPRFLRRFPSFESLATAPLKDILKEWSGLGYNRRARFLHEAAKRIVAEHDGRLPADPKALESLPGIGSNTAGSIVAFAYNKPVVFLETNIRTVYIYYFFPDRDGVRDQELLPLLERTLSREHPREWYYALMDLGVFIKARVGNLTRQSRSYARQAPFKGSLREVRGALLRYLTRKEGAASLKELEEAFSFDRDRLYRALRDLESEGIVAAEGSAGYRIPE